MYPYPSGDLHIGHWYIVTPTDALAPYRRMHGVNVFFPIGFDAFGLPAENAAIKSGGHPFTWTMSNIETMRRQFRSMGATFDWGAEVVTDDPASTAGTSEIFLRFFEAGLAYCGQGPRRLVPQGRHAVPASRSRVPTPAERSGDPVEDARLLEQWFLRITHYADELVDFSGVVGPSP